MNSRYNLIIPEEVINAPTPRVNRDKQGKMWYLLTEFEYNELLKRANRGDLYKDTKEEGK